MNKTLKTLALIVSFSLVLTGCGAINTQTYDLALGPEGSDFYALGEDLCKELSDGIQGARFNPVETGGSIDNVSRLSKGSVDVALMTADAAAEASSVNPKIRAIAPLFRQALHVVVTDTSGIRSLIELKSRRVSLGTQDSGTALLAEKVVASVGLDLRDIQRQYLDPSTAFEQMKNGNLDAFFILAAPGSVAIAELAEEVDIVLVPLDEDALNALVENESFSKGVIPAETYKNQNGSVASAFMDAIVVCTTDFPENIVTPMVSVIYEKAAGSLKKSGITVGNTNKIIGIPLHEGLEFKTDNE